MNKITHYITTIALTVGLTAGCAKANSKDKITLYLNGDNNTTITVSIDKVEKYTKDWKWSIEPTTLMYTKDNRQSYIWESEVEKYQQEGWSIYPPVTLYGNNYATLICFENEKQDYLNTGVWFATYEEANPARFTYEVFTRSNLTVEHISTMLSGLKIQAYAQDFYDMEHEYNINALYALSVATLESGGGAKTANKNNFFGFRGTRGWMSFSTPREGIFYFGKLMNNNLYYGKTMEQIGVIYCDRNWAPHVKRIMQEKWNILN